MLCPSRIHVPSCPCQKLRSLYGRGLFKCDRFRCQYYRVGFDTCSDRDSHLRIHNRPFKCPELNCEFSDIGFISEKDLSLHRSKTHQYHLSDMKDTASEMPADRFSPEDLISILKDAIEADEVEFVRNQYARAKVFDSWQHRLFVIAVAKTASPTMVDLLLEEYTSIYPNHISMRERALSAAIQGENMVVIKHLITRGADVNPDGERVIEAALETYNPEIVEFLLGHGAHLVECPSMFYRILKDDGKREDEVFNVLHRMQKYVVGKKAISNGLHDAIRRGSVPLAKYFIDNGADVNSKPDHRSPLLYVLVRDYSRRRVEGIKFLLQQGMNPYPKNREGLSIKSLVGMRKVEQYFDKSWDDLVKEAQAERASATNEG
jgi:hypothetical protein